MTPPSRIPVTPPRFEPLQIRLLLSGDTPVLDRLSVDFANWPHVAAEHDAGTSELETYAPRAALLAPEVPATADPPSPPPVSSSVAADTASNATDSTRDSALSAEPVRQRAPASLHGLATEDIVPLGAQANRPPVVDDLEVSGEKGLAIAADLPGHDEDGDALTYTVVAEPSRGAVTIDHEVGTFTYTPDGEFLSGTDVFQIVANDGQADSNVGTVTVTIEEYHANSPVGEAKGIHPGRVAWIHDPAATNWNGSSGYWWQDGNTDQDAVDSMVSRSVRWLTGEETDEAAWGALFRHFNQTHQRGDRAYQPGERIAVKINTNNCNGSYSETDNQLDASPHMVLALLRQLVNVVGVPQDMITVYDAVRLIPDKIFNRCHAELPGVRFEDRSGSGDRAATEWVPNVIDYSVNNGCGESIPRSLYEADYVINMALLKGHSTAGVTLTAKNHYGSINDREHTYIRAASQPMGTYNPFVDLIGHEHVGAKTMLFMIDALYGTNNVSAGPVRFQSAPFNNDWTSSLFVSQDPVAIDSVGLDFLIDEFATSQSFMRKADNYLHEAALAEAPPSGTVYDPEGDGSGLFSLGVHEHWNNRTDRQYSRNLGTGDGIQLLTTFIANDDTPPTAPSDLQAHAISDTEIEMTWTAAADPDTGVASYRIYRDGLRVGTTTTTDFTDTGLAALTMYTYTVSAVNGNGMEGPQSDPASETTLADTTAPTLHAVSATSQTQVEVTYSEAVDQTSAETVGNYSIDHGVVISAAALQPDGKTVRLTTSALSEGVTHVLTVGNTEDLAGNPVPSVIRAQFRWIPVPDPLVFQHNVSGYDGTVDTMLQENRPDANNATVSSLNVDADDPGGTGRHVQILLRFEDIFGEEPGRIPAGAQIASAWLDLEVSDLGSPLNLHRMLQGWADTDTWNSLVGGVQSNGVEAAAAPDASTAAVATGTLSIDVTSSLTAWQAEPAVNYGWAMLPTGTNGVDFDSAEGATPPKLTVNFMPWASNIGPVAIDDAHVVDEDDALVVPAPGLLGNDGDVEGDPLSVTLIDDVSHGALTLHADGSFEYTPHQDYFGPDAFTYKASDGQLDSNPAVVTLDVAPVNDAPMLDTAGDPALTSVEVGTTDPDGDAVAGLIGTSITDADGPGSLQGIAVTAADTSHGTWQYSTSGGADWADLGPVSDTAARLLGEAHWIRFVPAADFVGTATISYRAWDQTGGAAGGTADTSDHGGTTAFSTAVETATITILDDDELPAVTGVVLNPHPNQPERGLSKIDPSGWGVAMVRVTFSEPVTFAAGEVTAERVVFDDRGNATSADPIDPGDVTVTGSDTSEMTITFADAWETVVDTWVRITLAETITDADGHPLDGEPRSNSSGLGYIYGAKDDLPSGDGEAGGAAIFYVGSLRGDMRGYGPGDVEPDGEITPWDITGFTQKYLAGNLDADMAGYGPGQTQPDADVNPWDISGFTSRYIVAIAEGKHLDPLPTAGGQGMAAGGPTLLPPETALLAKQGLGTEGAQDAPEPASTELPSLEIGERASRDEFRSGLRAEEEVWTTAAPAPTATDPVEPSVDPALAPDAGVPDLLALSALDVRL